MALLPSRYQFSDRVRVKLDSHTPPVEGQVTGISFSENKVFYDIQTEYELLTRIDSALIVVEGDLGTTLA